VTTYLCAICASDVDLVVERPLGKNDAMVKVCIECDEGAIVEQGPRFEYEPTGGLLSDKQVTKAARKTLGDDVYEREIARDVEIGIAPAPARKRGSR